jgi:hypothetical protein
VPSGGAVVGAPKTGLSTKTEVLKAKCMSFARTRGLAAVIVFVIVAVALISMNPLIVQRKAQDEDEDTGERSPRKVLMWSLSAALLALLLPPAVKFFQKRSAAAKLS